MIPEADGDIITIQSMVNQIRTWEDNQVNLSYPRLLLATGKEDLGSGTKVGITAVLENARIKFAERGSPTVCSVSGGNLVAIDGNGDPMNPIEYAENVTVTLAQSSSTTQIETGTSGLTQEESTELLTLYELHGLDPTKPLVIKRTSRKAGSIDQSISVSDDTVTVTRQS